MFSRLALTALAALFASSVAACSSADAGAPGAPSNPSAAESPDEETGAETGAASPPLRVDLGNVAAGAEVSFDVPAGTLGFTVVVDASVAPEDFIGVEELRDPTGEIVVAEYRDAKSEVSRAISGPSGAGIGVLTIPLVSDRASAPVRSGRWKTKLGGATLVKGAVKGTVTPWSGNLHAVVLFQKTSRSDGSFGGGLLDLDVYVPDGLRVNDEGASRAVDATSAAADPAIRARLDKTFDLYKSLYGIDRGDVRFHRVAESVASIVGQEAIDDANVLATATGARPSGQIVLTNRLAPDGDDGGDISGISSCLPGAIGTPATKCSAVIVALRGSAAWEDAATIVHELGHFIGLEHTTELGGGGGDTLMDTPECASTEDKGAITSCPDFDNLMFPTTSVAGGQREVTVSPTQKRLMQASTLYRSR